MGETLVLTEDEVENGQREDGSWLIRGETYNVVEIIPEPYFSFATIVQRESDKKHFRYREESYGSFNKEIWNEVCLITTTITRTAWEDV